LNAKLNIPNLHHFHSHRPELSRNKENLAQEKESWF